MRLIRVFPRRTRATPDDDLAYVGSPDLFAEADAVHVSVTFTYDKARAEQLAEEWRWVAPVTLGRVAYGDDSLEHAARRLLEAGFTRCSHRLRCYVLIGYPKDTFDAATTRLQQMLDIGMTPMAMLWRPETVSQERYAPPAAWRAFQRRWARPAIIHHGDEGRIAA